MVRAVVMPVKASKTFLANHYPSVEEISARAHQIFVERGEEPGHDIDDWLQAEHELMKRVLPHRH